MDLLILFGAFIVGLVAGVSTATFGIGGAMLLIPTFRIVFGMSGHEAIATALMITIPATFFGALQFHIKRTVKVKTALVAGLIGSVFAVIGAYMTEFFEGHVLMIMLGILFLILSYISLKREVGEPQKASLKKKAVGTAIVGAIGGFLSGFFGIGGGGVLVPSLMRIRKVPISAAVPTSLAIIVIYSIPGSLAHLAMGNVVIDLVIPVALGSVIGATFTAKHIGKQDQKLRHKAFVAFMVLMGLFILIRELFF